MKISWGVKITMLYMAFVVLIVTMVVASHHQHFDLVSDKYYADEIVYQKTIDAGKNQSELSQPVSVHANENAVTLELPAELKGKATSGSVYFYSAVHAAWDKRFPLNSNSAGNIAVQRSELQKTRYTIKIDIEADGRRYYQESAIDLSK